VTSTGCTPAPEVTTGAEWASAAEAYAAALNDAYRVGITDAMPFYAPDAHVDKRFINYEGIGRPGFAQALRDNAQNPPTWTGGRDNSDQIDLVPTEPLYLSRDRFLEPLRRIDPAIVPAIDAAFLYTVGAAGLTDVAVIVGGIVPDEDEDMLLAAGVAKVFHPGGALEDIARYIRDITPALRAQRAAT
jgi:hypothetical protein